MPLTTLQFKTAWIWLSFVVLSGCGAMMDSQTAHQVGVDSTPPFVVTRVFYATDREPLKTTPALSFTAIRGSAISYGIAEVSIPRDHKMGTLETPSIWRLEFAPDPKHHIMLQMLEVKEPSAFYTEVAKRVQSFDTKSAFVFVHGYNVSFEGAALRTAQMAYDLGFRGAPVFYSWPSIGSLEGYIADEDNVEWSRANLARFLQEFAARSTAANIYLIGHSMGTRALTRAYVTAVTNDPSLKSRFKEIILAAPDIDAGLFKSEIAPGLFATGAPVTLYASSKDNALLASKKLHRNIRLGESTPSMFMHAGMESIDASAVDTSFLGHSYFADERSVISDMFYLIGTGLRAKDRAGLKSVAKTDGTYWAFRK